MRAALLLVASAVVLAAFVPTSAADKVCAGAVCVPVPCTSSVVRCATQYCTDHFAICNWPPPIECLDYGCMPP